MMKQSSIALTALNTSRLVDLEKYLKSIKWKSESADARVITRAVLQACSEKCFGSKYGFAFITKNPDLQAPDGMFIVPSTDGSYVNPFEVKSKSSSPKRKAVRASKKQKSSNVVPLAAPLATPPENYAVAATKSAVEHVEAETVRVRKDIVVSSIPSDISLVPEGSKTFVPFGCHDMISRIIASRRFFPIYVTGLSGNGKTYTIKQACAQQGREFFRLPINKQTEESDLIGTWTLENDNTVYQYGPVVEAMLRGAVLLLDEYDLGGAAMMALQPVMEGEGLYIKKINKFIEPAPGFTVIATANTMGRGERPEFAGAQIINEAALDRFKMTLHHDYPDEKVEKKILKLNAVQFGLNKDDPTCDYLAKWAQACRASYTDGAVECVLTTRRIVAALELYAILGNAVEAVSHICARFADADRGALVKSFELISGLSTSGDVAAEDATPAPF